METTLTTHTIGTREEWHAACTALLERENEHTRMGDELARQRRSLPWVPVEKEYTLQTAAGAPIEKLLAYRERMGWKFDWASSYESDFNTDVGFSSSLEQTREAIDPLLDQLPPVAFRNAEAAGTDIYGYLTELFGFTAFSLENGGVYQAYSTTGRGVEFLMPYYGSLDRAPVGRDEGESGQLWIRRHDDYDAE